MDWDDLRYVLAIGRTGTLSGAARALEVTHSTVFRRIGLIEERMGVRIFERFRDGYTLTSAGEEIVRVAKGVEENVSDLERRILGRDMRPSGIVRVTTTDTLLARLLPAMFAAFRGSHPEIDLEVIVSNEFISLTKRDADVAIRATSQPTETLVGRRICNIATAVYASRSYLARASSHVGLTTDPWVSPDDSLPHLLSARWLRSLRPEVSVSCRVNTVLGMLEAAKAGMGLAALPCFLADLEPSLVRIKSPIKELTTQLWLLTHKDLRRVARIRAFLDFMAGELSKKKPLLEGRQPSSKRT
ncbi:MAG: LysR family transcriptional regulator [Deltaproteobacteria bacterium]|nr:LysR family transcriptional regulator [Deltaproteobacteria bacterium]